MCLCTQQFVECLSQRINLMLCVNFKPNYVQQKLFVLKVALEEQKDHKSESRRFILWEELLSSFYCSATQ